MDGRFRDDELRRGAPALSTISSAPRIVLHLPKSGLSATRS